MKLRRLTAALATAMALTLTVSACGSGTSGNESNTGETISIEDNSGTVEVPKDPQRVVTLDNRSFETLESWGIKPVAAAKALMPADNPQKNDDSIQDIGNHREPDFEVIVAAKPDLVITGQRFRDHSEEVKKYSGDAPIVNLEPREGEDLGEELKRQTTTLGEIFGKQDEAKKLNDDFDASVKRVKDAYNKDEKVMSVITTGGNINFAAPHDGRTLGPVYDMLGLTPSLEVKDSSSDHQGDDISVEAIAKSNPDWILVMDRDAAISPNNGEKYTPANELLAGSEALKNVNAVKNKHIVYMPQDTYLNEGLQTYTEFYNSLADAMEKK